MKKMKLLFLVILIGLAGLGIWRFTDDKAKDDNYASALPGNNPPPLEVPTKDEIMEILNGMSLEEKIGQMLIVDFQNPTLSEDFISLLTEVRPGGFILFGPNFTTYNDTLNLVKTIKSTSKIPMFISVDEEGGRVQRTQSITDENIIDIPAMQKLGNTDDPSLAYEVGSIIAQKLKVFGINMDFAPDADIFSNPNNTVIGDRSFGSDAYLVSKMSNALANGLLSQNVIPVYKHFPGHGDTKADSHVEIPIVAKTKDELKNLELIPFKSAIENNAEVIMVGHLAVPSITGDNTPASLSKNIITDLLKKEMGYKGLVITDSLRMKAITDNYSDKEMYLLTINAGVDILLMPRDPKDAVAKIKEMVTNGDIKEERINESVYKILTLKKKTIYNNYNDYLGKEYLNKPAYNNTIDKFK